MTEPTSTGDVTPTLVAQLFEKNEDQAETIQQLRQQGVGG